MSFPKDGKWAYLHKIIHNHPSLISEFGETGFDAADGHSYNPPVR